MSSDICLPHLLTSQTVSNDDLKLDDDHHISEDSGACESMPADASKTIESADNHSGGKSSKEEQEEDTLYTDSFESSSNHNDKDDSLDEYDIILHKTEDNPKPPRPPSKKPQTAGGAKPLREILLRAESLKKIYSKNEGTTLFKSSRFSRSSSTQLLNVIPSSNLTQKSLNHLHFRHTPPDPIDNNNNNNNNTNKKQLVRNSFHSQSPALKPKNQDALTTILSMSETNNDNSVGRSSATIERVKTSTSTRRAQTSKERLKSAATIKSTITVTNERVNEREASAKPTLKPLLIKSSKNQLKTYSTQYNPLNNLENQYTRSNDIKKTSSLQTKTSITVDTSKSRSNLEVVNDCIKELEWQGCQNGLANQSCDIIWLSTNQETEPTYNNPIPQYSKINKFPSMNIILKKAPLTQALNVMRQIYKDEYNFYPRTWFLPEQLREFMSECRYIHEKQFKAKEALTTFILKPNDGSQGEGIFLIKDAQEYLSLVPQRNRPRPYIVQEYIHNPFLIDGLKSDLRLYVIIASVKPLEIYLCDEGLVRFATINYQFPDESNLRSSYMHLTNYSINKKNEDYKFYDKEAGCAVKVNVDNKNQTESITSTTNTNAASPDQNESNEGSKRKLTSVLAYIEAKGYNVNKIRDQIDDLVAKTVLALLPEINVNTAFESVNKPTRHKTSYFQILGFDILLTDQLKPILLEVNCNPSLRIDYEIQTENGKHFIPSSIDTDIKRPLVLETLKLAAPKAKLDIIEQCKKKEEQIEKANKYRDSLVKQRMVERYQQKQSFRKFDYNRCPLLSKPGEQYIKKLSNKKASPRSLNLFNEFSQVRSSSSSHLHQSSISNSAQFNKSTCSFASSDSLLISQNLTSQSQSKTEKSCLRNIYPNVRNEDQYENFFILNAISEMFINFTVSNGVKIMTHSDFRSFVKKCKLVNENTTSDNLDIIFFDLSKKWELYNRKKNVENIGLCYQAFVQFFLTFSQLNFDERNIELNLKLMINYCKFNLKKSESTKPNEDSENYIEGPGFQNEIERSKTCTPFSSGSACANRSTFSVTEKYQNTAPVVNQIKSGLSKSLLVKPNKIKKSLFPIFFDSSSKA